MILVSAHRLKTEVNVSGSGGFVPSKGIIMRAEKSASAASLQRRSFQSFVYCLVCERICIPVLLARYVAYFNHTYLCHELLDS